MSKESKSTAVQQSKAGALSTHVDYGTDAQGGFENQTQADVTLPFLAVLQSNSPQITSREDCKPGMLFNTVTEEVYDGIKTGVIIVPALTQHVYVEWKPRDKGGGFVAVHQPESDVVTKAKAASTEFGKYKTPAGNDLAETFYIYGMMVEGDAPSMPVVIGFASTKIAVYKKWNTKVKMFQVQTPDNRRQTPPLFAHLTRLKTVPDENPKGKFFNFQLEPARGTSLKDSLLEPGHELLVAAKGLKEMVEKSQVKVAYDTQAKTGGDEQPAGNGGAPASGGKPIF